MATATAGLSANY